MLYCVVYSIYFWVIYGCAIGIIKKVEPEDVPDEQLWKVFLNGPMWWVTYIIFKIKRKR